MKTFSLLAAALLVTGAASAQIASPSIGANPGANALTPATGTVNITVFTRNISTIQQVGTGQYALVQQNGPQVGNANSVRQNEASLIQVAPSAGSGNNNAFQTQTNSAAGGGAATAAGRTANRMEGTQFGVNSIMSQTQTGSGNRATGLQTASSANNLMTQVQTGLSNQAYAEQRGSLSRSAQTQTGQRNQGVVIQTAPAPQNLAIQNQTGNDNRAYAGQGSQGNPGSFGFGSGYNHSDQAQVGSLNFSRTDQFGADDRSTVTQNGVSNTSIVVQQ